MNGLGFQFRMVRSDVDSVIDDGFDRFRLRQTSVRVDQAKSPRCPPKH